MKTVIIVPTYNEVENLPRLAASVLDLPLDDLSLLVVDDNSPDGTGQLAEDLGRQYGGRVEVIHRPGKMGLGSAYIQGFKCALDMGAGMIGQMDADFSHPIDTIPLLAAALKHVDVALGSRYVPGGRLDDSWPLWRKRLSAFGNFYARTILSIPVQDVTGGFRLWRRETLKAIPLDRVRSNGYVFQVEMAYVAHKLGFRFTEIPIYFAERRCGQSKMSFRIQVEAAFRTWALINRYRDLRPRQVAN